MEFIQEAFDNLNDNFAGEFSDVPTANTQINFCIANASTDGEPIEGIRYYDWDNLNIEEWGRYGFFTITTFKYPIKLDMIEIIIVMFL